MKKKIIKKVEKILSYNDDEVNDLPYDLALQNDNRTYCLFYLSLMRTNHSFIYTFIYNKDYNSKIIKIDLFLVIFASSYAVNTLFYTDETMHNRTENKGSLNIEYQLPKIVYSSLISTFLEFLLKLLALSSDAISDFKKDREIKNIHEREKQLKKTLRIKFTLYFILSFILLLFFSYYTSMFCAVYPNTQKNLLYDTLMSLALSFFTPFFIYLIPGCLRIPALADHRRRRICLYKLSKIPQML